MGTAEQSSPARRRDGRLGRNEANAESSRRRRACPVHHDPRAKLSQLVGLGQVAGPSADMRRLVSAAQIGTAPSHLDGAFESSAGAFQPVRRMRNSASLALVEARRQGIGVKQPLKSVDIDRRMDRRVLYD